MNVICLIDVTWQWIFASIIICCGAHKFDLHASSCVYVLGEMNFIFGFCVVMLDLLDSSCCEMSSLSVVQYIKELVAWVGR